MICFFEPVVSCACNLVQNPGESPLSVKISTYTDYVNTYLIIVASKEGREERREEGRKKAWEEGREDGWKERRNKGWKYHDT